VLTLHATPSGREFSVLLNGKSSALSFRRAQKMKKKKRKKKEYLHQMDETLDHISKPLIHNFWGCLNMTRTERTI